MPGDRSEISNAGVVAASSAIRGTSPRNWLGWSLALLVIAACFLFLDIDEMLATVRRIRAYEIALVLASMVGLAVWAEIGASAFYRALGAAVVLDVLLVALQPILAAARREPTVHRLRLVAQPGGELETTVEAPDFAAAAAKAIRTAERNGTRVLGVTRIESGDSDD